MQDLSGVPGDKMISRRQFLTVAGAGALSIAAQRALATSDNHAPTRIPAREGATAVPAVNGRVVVVGGGMGGATAARFLKLWGGAQLQVILIEKNLSYTSNILSNLVLTGQKTISGLQYAYAQLQAIGVTVMQGEVLAINAGPRTLSLAGGQLISYDRLVLSPGIDFDLLPGLANYDDIVHAWQAGPQTTRLAQQLQAMPAGGVFVMTIPAAPYRCPPGPYERACVVADYVQRLKPGSKVIVLDANPNVMAERHTFETAFGGIFANTVEYHSVTVNSIDAATRTIDTSIGAIAGACSIPSRPIGLDGSFETTDWRMSAAAGPG
jgi:NADPH-dependent 2,4-dienoyl-CoA reductase/sulfur reductase-like enzyme